MTNPADSHDERIDVIDVLHRFARGIDGRDFELYRSVFADEIDLDYSSYRPENIGRWKADDWAARAARLFPGFDATMHAITNASAVIDGDQAVLDANVQAHHVVVVDGTTRRYTIAGAYHDRLERTAVGWRIVAKTLQVWWTEGDPDVMRIAVERTNPERSSRERM
jgi:hypothetical protein